MSATQFEDSCPKKDAKTAKKAYKALVEEAHYYCGHSGYTGTICETDGFKLVKLPANIAPDTESTAFKQWMEITRESEFKDKWGPCACVELPDHWFFFGWASS